MARDNFSEVTARLYAAISGPPGACDWTAFRSLFRPGARLIRVSEQVRKDSASGRVNVMSVEQFIEDVAPVIEPNDFVEQEISQSAETSLNMASVTSKCHACLITPKGKRDWSSTYFIHLILDARGWRIVNILWNERA